MRFIDFTTSSIAARERYDAWRERPWPSMSKLMRTQPPAGGFYSHSRAFDLGPLVLNDTRMTGQTYERTSSMASSDGFDRVSIAITLEGRYHGVTSVGAYRGAASSILIGDMSMAFVQSSTNARCITLTLERKAMARLVPRVETLHGLVLSGHDAQPLVRQVLSDLGELPALEEADGPLVAERLIGTFLSCVGTSAPCVLSEDAAQRRLKTEIRWILEQRFREPELDIDRIATLARVSRATLYRAFDDPSGITSALTRLRLRKAAAALHDPRDKRLISEIAHSVGYTRNDTFSRAFRETYGCSPREWRNASKGQAPPLRMDRP
ncbi:AraC family transcriptional regulator [Aureimonas sp. AU20]|uniref:helix-turn-helix transcriptional regulator n=1 Tax=Aureimonas sp. AU20 TaxID=1349819 RepID=UPI000720B033|nr:AraC family transcriptional regulator [Aureimonas sp. AU20]ALN74598.1 hypothetical protein M673_17920 [Aureimonas sp. AU20]